MSSEPVHALIVDDDRSIQRLLADALSRKGFSVTVERDGEWALQAFEQKPVDVIILDLLLPAINGFEVAKRIKATPKGRAVPIIMTSGIYTSPVHQKDALAHGAVAFLPKPFKLSALEAALKTALGDRYPSQVDSGPAAEAPAPPNAQGSESFADAAAQEEALFVENAARSVPSLQSIRGTLSARPFGEVLAEIHRWRATGALLLRRDKVKKIVYFREGVPRSVKSNLLSECLGRVMVRERMISEAECEESLRRMKASGRQQGTTLIEMSCISPHNLVYALELQMRVKLFDLFSWETGEYQFDPKAVPPSDTVTLDLSCAAVIHEGVKRGYGEARLTALLGEIDDRFPRRSDDPLFALQEVGLDEEELQILRACDGTKTVAQLRKLGPLSKLEVDRLIYALRCAQAIELLERPRSLPPPMPIRGTLLPDLPGSGVPEGGAGASQEAPADHAPLLPELGDLDTVAPAEEEAQVRERLAAKIERMKQQNAFEVLGVSETATPEEVAAAHFALAAENHPGKYASHASAEVRGLAQEIYTLLETAHRNLSDPESKDRYLEQAQAGNALPEISAEVNLMLAAESRFKQGLERLRAEALDEAAQRFQEAIDLYDQEGEFHAYLAWTTFQQSPGNKAAAKSALRMLERAVELNPGLDRTYLFMGQIHKAMGNTDRAEKQFEKALQCNPSCPEALHELSILSWASRLSRAKL